MTSLGYPRCWFLFSLSPPCWDPVWVFFAHGRKGNSMSSRQSRKVAECIIYQPMRKSVGSASHEACCCKLVPITSKWQRNEHLQSLFAAVSQCPHNIIFWYCGKARGQRVIKMRWLWWRKKHFQLQEHCQLRFLQPISHFVFFLWHNLGCAFGAVLLKFCIL